MLFLIKRENRKMAVAIAVTGVVVGVGAAGTGYILGYRDALGFVMRGLEQIRAAAGEA